MNDTATYSPEDNKLRLYPAARLDAATYARVKAAGFSWAPKQGLFVAPMWTPEREDLLLELCGEVGDEDTSLVQRAEARADRFEDYSEKRQADADSAAAAVKRLADGIPLGQPILVGHHSERHARKDAERIENGMRRAVKMWETSKYWTERAAGAISAAKYKERPDVRARRIKGLESEQRKQLRNVQAAKFNAQIWENIHDDAKTTLRRKDGAPTTFAERALRAAGQGCGHYSLYSGLQAGTLTPEDAQRQALESSRVTLERCARWLAHFENRLAYERAMLAASGGTVAERTGPEKGGACRCWASRRGAWSYIQKVNRVSVTVLDNWGNGGRNFTRTIPFDKLHAVMTAAQVKEARDAGRTQNTDDGTGFYLMQSRQDFDKAEAARGEPNEAPAEQPAAAPFEAMRETLRAGVQVVAVPQLFPTPAALAARMVEAADIQPGQRVLEPSAGTGSILGAMGGRMFGHQPERGAVAAVEINATLAERLRAEFPLTDVRCADFLQCNGDLGTFDRIVMNPPFSSGQDVQHIRHALQFLKPGGRLVALCANGPRQAEALRPLAEESGGYWEDLPAGSFKEAGTGVNVALLVIER